LDLLQNFPALRTPAPGVEFVALPDARFKRALLHLHFELPLDERSPARTLLAQILPHGTERHPGRRWIAQALQEAYGAELDLACERSGESQQLTLRLSWVGEKFLPAGSDVLPALLNLAHEVWERPLRGPSGAPFDPATVALERAQLLRRIEAFQDDRSAWAEQRFIETMCAGEPYARRHWGTEAEVKELDEAALEAARVEVLSRARGIAVAVGPVDPEPIASFLAEWLGGRAEPPAPAPVEQREPRLRRTLREELPCDQARFFAGWRCAMPDDPAEREALALAVSVFGGGVHSRLFRIVREERSQAYSIFAHLRARKGLMTIEAGLDAAHAESVLAEADAQIADLATRGPRADELEQARSGLADRLRSIGDRPAALAAYFARERALGLARAPAQRLALLAQLGPSEVARAAARWLPDTVYLLAPPAAVPPPVPAA
jgi:predicted Zn-dependent peptidase